MRLAAAALRRFPIRLWQGQPQKLLAISQQRLCRLLARCQIRELTKCKPELFVNRQSTRLRCRSPRGSGPGVTRVHLGCISRAHRISTCGTGVANRNSHMNETSTSLSAGRAWLGLHRNLSCPRCSDFDTRRARTRGPLERLLKVLTGWRSYRCEACAHRFLAWR